MMCYPADVTMIMTMYGETLPWPGGRRGGAGPGRVRGSWWRRCCVAKRQVGAGAGVGGPPTALLT